MDTLLNEIKQLAQQGLEKSIISRDEENKDIFMQIMLKAEVAINKVEQSSAHKNVVAEKENFSTRTYERIDEDAKSDMYLIAYCFSRFEHTSLYPQYSQDKSFIIAAEKLGVKKNTLKNSRDWFDGHNNNTRKGWWQAPLPEDMQKFKEIYDLKSKNEVIAEAKNILGIKEITNKTYNNFGLKLKSEEFHGKFLSKDEVERFIDIVLTQSPTPVKDLVEQCSQRTFMACYDTFKNIYKQPVESLSKEIVKCDPRTASNSVFSLWIRARFIKEIFEQGLHDECFNFVNK